MAIIARVTGVADRPEPNGEHVIQIDTSTGLIEAAISPDIAVALVRLLQPAIVQRASALAQNVALPRLDVARFDIAHQGPQAQLMACTDQMGYVVLEASTDTLLKLKDEIDRTLRMRSPSGEAH
jgi:hypothetical protein